MNIQDRIFMEMLSQRETIDGYSATCLGLGLLFSTIVLAGQWYLVMGTLEN